MRKFLVLACFIAVITLPNFASAELNLLSGSSVGNFLRDGTVVGGEQGGTSAPIPDLITKTTATFTLPSQRGSASITCSYAQSGDIEDFQFDSQLKSANVTAGGLQVVSAVLVFTVNKESNYNLTGVFAGYGDPLGMRVRGTVREINTSSPPDYLYYSEDTDSAPELDRFIQFGEPATPQTTTYGSRTGKLFPGFTYVMAVEQQMFEDFFDQELNEATGDFRFIVTPTNVATVPEPSSIVLALSGSGAICSFRKRRKSLQSSI